MSKYQTIACGVSYSDTEHEGRLVRVSISLYELVHGRTADFNAIFVQDLDGCFILAALVSHGDSETRTIC